MISVNDIITSAYKLAPAKYAFDWDNIGLHVGSKQAEVEKVLITLDINKDTIEEAVNNKCQMIISHHPLIFKPISKINFNNEKGKLLHKIIYNNLNIACFHTNLDIAAGGLNDYLARIIGLEDMEPLQIDYNEKYYKLVVYVPVEHFNEVQKAVLDKGAGQIGKYSHCSFSTKGEGTFKPLTGSEPYQGRIDEISNVQEKRLETIVREDKVQEVISVIKTAHPYEEVAYDLFMLYNNRLGSDLGIGRIGSLKKEYKLDQYLSIIKDKLNLKQIKYTGGKNKKIKQVAVCSGSGADYIEKAVEKGADLYITGDIKFHQAQLAEELGLALIDAGHYKTEIIVKDLLCNYFNDCFKGVTFIKSVINTNPWSYI